MRIFSKAIVLLIMVLFIRLMYSCCFITGGCSCDETPIPYSLTNLEITNLDNSGAGCSVTESNSMYSTAVAFELMLSDTNQLYPYKTAYLPRVTTIGFSGAYAFSYDCDPYFTAQEKIDAIKVVTLFDLNSYYTAGSEISQLFYAKTNNFPNTGLYDTMGNVINHLNTAISNHPYQQVQFFLSQPVENDNAQFVFVIHLNNGITLTDTTNVISILPN